MIRTFLFMRLGGGERGYSWLHSSLWHSLPITFLTTLTQHVFSIVDLTAWNMLPHNILMC